MAMVVRAVMTHWRSGRRRLVMVKVKVKVKVMVMVMVVMVMHGGEG